MKYVLFLIVVALSINNFAQNMPQDVLFTVDKQKVTADEFMNVYNKNNKQLDESVDKTTINEYLELYINFKLKVHEAEQQGLHKDEKFLKEISGYREQLAKTLLRDTSVINNMIEEAYNRMKYDLRVSHIMVKLPKHASSEDTVAAYKKIMKIREEVIKGGDFAKIARDKSEDMYASRTGGDIGYFSALTYAYPFESAAYNLKVGDVSMPVRTVSGYHLIKLTDKRPNMGEVRVAHLFVKAFSGQNKEDSLSAHKKVAMLYEQLQKGAEFETLVKEHSEDPGTKNNGGLLPWFGAGRMLVEFEKACVELKVGAYSKPVKTPKGWHIIKKIEEKPLPSFEEKKQEIKARINNDKSRQEIAKQSFISSLKKMYNFKENTKTLAPYYKIIDNSITAGKWTGEKAENLKDEVFSFADKKYTQKDFTQYMVRSQRKMGVRNLNYIIEMYYKDFVESTLIEYEDSQLENKYPYFKELMKEYRDGILLFNLTDDMVWSKAIKDTTGLEAFYNKNKEKYKWPEKATVTYYYCKNDAEKVMKTVKKGVAKNWDNNKIKSKINKKDTLLTSIETKTYYKTDDLPIEKWETGFGKVVKDDGKIFFYNVSKIEPPSIKALKDARGLVISDYQQYLEKEWIAELKAKYKVEVNKDLLKKMIDANK